MANGKFIVGPNTKKSSDKDNYTDHELKYANKGFVLEFFHIPSGKTVQFKAMLTKFEDRYESSWKSEQVYGRNDPIQNFQGTKRTISIGWDLVAASWGEAKDNLQRATLLNTMLYPSYDEGSCGDAATIIAAPMFKLSFANLIHNYGRSSDTCKNKKATDHAPRIPETKSPYEIDQPGPTKKKLKLSEGSSSPGGMAVISGLVGTVSGFTYAPILEAGFFDPIEEQGNLYPQTINLSCEYTVMHTTRLGWSGKNFRSNNFPYGRPIENLGGIDAKKQVMQDAKRDTGTLQQRLADRKKILSGEK